MSCLLYTSIPLITDAETFAGNRLLIGGPEHNAYTRDCISSEDFKAKVPGPEGMMIQTFGAVSYTHLDVYKRQP